MEDVAKAVKPAKARYPTAFQDDYNQCLDLFRAANSTFQTPL
jgi:hypothetical protein